MTINDSLTEEEWDKFQRDGYLHLGKLISNEELEKLKHRIDDIMLGNIQYDNLIMQLDPGGSYGQTGNMSQQTPGFKGATLDYRKLGEATGGLECDDLFLHYMTLPIFRHINARVYGSHARISMYRAMMMNKPANKGTELPWHQDGGLHWGLTHDPLITTWTALNDVTEANGCVQIVRGTHKVGLMSDKGHTLSQEHVEKYCTPDKIVNLELKEGECVLLHNWLVHKSGVNKTENPRRGFSACYVDSRTKVSESGTLGGPGEPGQSFPVITFDRWEL